ncbi:hypothetical protein RSOLAG22IIIB_00714 [Rhizoctonia solani]|uniref:Right handed beta helix domain-containing protein n=1 Tax=Rhizoctonia solani TaxID=456999 RepID=A0A0K6FVQ9_9AGAM|nr:hypothetical protein RSOLAG22IIIB_00714 [Rhizoctonia solani]
MISARAQVLLLASGATIFPSLLAHPRDDRAFWKRSLSPPVYTRQQDCISPEPAETVTDRLNTLLNSSGPGYILPLCQKATYRLTAPLVYAAANQEISTVGYPLGDERAILLVDGFWNDTNGHSVAVQGNCIGCNDIKLRNIQINGARNGRALIQGGGNIEFGGPNANQLIEYVSTYDPRAWTCLHVAEGALNCTNIVIQNNEIGPCGSDAFASWADGVSLSCRNSIVRDNWIESPTDGGIVVFGSPGSLIQNNTIWIEDNTLLGGINVVDYDPFNGDYTNTIVENNTIIGGFATDQSTDAQDANVGFNNETAIIKMGLAVGNRVWFGDKFGRNRNFGGIVRNNRLTGAFGWGVVVSGTRDFVVENNEIVGNSTFIGFRGVNCSITEALPSPEPFLYDSNGTDSTVIPSNYPDVRLDGALLCITSPDGGDYWPRGGSPYGNPDKEEAGAEGEGSASSRQGSSTSRKLGLGLGITFGILAALVAAWFVHRWGVKRYAATNSPATPPKF